jgi:TRAP-type mannitol/chloroaromatic compound transport system permease large subunit
MSNPYGMDDNLHMHDLKHTMVGDRRTARACRPIRIEREQRRDDGRRAEMNAAGHFRILLAVLMLTGMPISISLGLTVLTFLFTMTQVPLESVALKLFTGIEKFEIMAIPFFILAGNFLTHGGVAKRMINFASDGRALVRRPRSGRRAGLRAVRGGLRLQPATVVAIGSILLPAMVKAGFPEQVRGRVSSPPPARWAS